MTVTTGNFISSDPLFHRFQYFSLFSFPIQFLAYLRLVNMEPLLLAGKDMSNVVFERLLWSLGICLPQFPASALWVDLSGWPLWAALTWIHVPWIALRYPWRPGGCPSPRHKNDLNWILLNLDYCELFLEFLEVFNN